MTTPTTNPINRDLGAYSFESLLNTYNDGSDTFYNLAKSIIFDFDPAVFDSYYTLPVDTWYYISYKTYGTMDLWWVVCCCNPDINPVKPPPVGTKLKLVKKEYVNSIIDQLNTK